MHLMVIRQNPQLKSMNGRDVTKRAIMDGNSFVSGRNYDILTLIVTHLLTSRAVPNLCQTLIHSELRARFGNLWLFPYRKGRGTPNALQSFTS